ncbi:hypothetical protein [Leifsonia xyli]|uniref:hypothetical protein n=1 Tax=Leifsonia xyli TaxID=1575 RepID=UPI003D66A731
MSRRLALAPDEADRIRFHARTGSLDLDAPGTAAIVAAAERTCAHADLWGRTAADRRHSLLATLVISAATVMITAVCLLPWPA